jgi:hypothetical protein
VRVVDLRSVEAGVPIMPFIGVSPLELNDSAPRLATTNGGLSSVIPAADDRSPM